MMDLNMQIELLMLFKVYYVLQNVMFQNSLIQNTHKS